MHFSALCQRCNIKLIDFATVEIADPRTGSNHTTVMCYLESENAWCDSGTAICLTKDAAREEASKRFLELLEKHNFDDKSVANLDTRSSSPVCTAKRANTDKRVRSVLLIPSEAPIKRSKSTSPRLDDSVTPLVSPRVRERSRSVFGSIKAIFRSKK